MKDEQLVRVTAHSVNIQELSIYKRISVNYPLLCRDEVARRIAKVADSMPDSLKLQIDSAYRTRKTQVYIWEKRNKDGVNIVFDPSSGMPPHCTGSALDVSLVDEGGKEINLSAPLKNYYEEPMLISGKISKYAQEVRILLNKIMLQNGFAPNPREYWHFSYGDGAWADYYKKNIVWGSRAL